MSDENALTPTDQRTVEFYGDRVTAVLVQAGDEEQVYVPVRPICDFLGVAWSAQRLRIQRDPVLSDVAMSVIVTITDIDPESRRPRTSTMLSLPLEYLNGWLFGISASRVKDDIRERLIRYQRECYRILANAFLGRSETAVTPQAAALWQIRAMGEAITRVADELIALERRQTSTESRLDQAAQFVSQMNKRLTAVERQIRVGNLTEAQAREVQHRVNLVALELTKREPGEKHHPGVYEVLRHETGATTYKSIPPAGYQAAIEFLDNWLAAIGQAGDE